MTPCHKVPMYLDPMMFDETNLRFGHYARCSSCHKLYGEAKLIYTAPKGIRESWTAYSEVATREYHARGDGRPLRFRIDKQGLVPVGYQAAQVEIPEVEEPPF